MSHPRTIILVTLAVIGLILALVRVGFAQVVVPATPPADLNSLTHQMGERVGRLAQDIQSDLGQTPNGPILLQDARELAQAVDDFHETLHHQPAPGQVRRSYAGIDNTWHDLRERLSQPGVATAAVLREARSVDDLDAQIHRAIPMHTPPTGFYGAARPPTGLGETMRLAHAMEERAAALAATVQTSVGDGNPAGRALRADAADLARATDAFRDAIHDNQPIAEVARAFAPVDQIDNRVEQDLGQIQAPAPVLAAWQAYASVEVLIHQNLGLTSPRPAAQLSVAAPPDGGPSPLVALADDLVTQTSAFVNVFGATGGKVPEGAFILSDAQRLQAAATAFQQNVAGGLDAGQLAFGFRDVDMCWQRLARRVNRLAQGRTGPNIDQVNKLGVICEQIHRALAMPGYPPVFSTNAAPETNPDVPPPPPNDVPPPPPPQP